MSVDMISVGLVPRNQQIVNSTQNNYLNISTRTFTSNTIISDDTVKDNSIILVSVIGLYNPNNDVYVSNISNGIYELTSNVGGFTTVQVLVI